MILIREARAHDDEVLGELLVEAFVESYARRMPEVVVEEARKRDLRDVGRKRESSAAVVLVAEFDGETAGTLTIQKPEGATRAWTPNTAEIRYMAVGLRHQGKGISRALLDRAKEVAREWGVSAICLHVRRGAEGVIRVYKENGYVRVPDGDVDMLPEIFLEGFYLSL